MAEDKKTKKSNNNSTKDARSVLRKPLQLNTKFDKIKRRKVYGKNEEAPGGKIYGILHG